MKELAIKLGIVQQNDENIKTAMKTVNSLK